MCPHAGMLSRFSHVLLFATLWTIACQVPQSMRFSRQECWRGFPCPPPGDLPNTGTEPESPVAPALQADSLPLSHQGSPYAYICTCKHMCVHTHTHTSVFAFILIFTKNSFRVYIVLMTPEVVFPSTGHFLSTHTCFTFGISLEGG